MAVFLVTGGAGFIGSNIANRLLNDNHTVRIVDNFSTGRRVNIEPFLNNPNFELIEGDICDIDTMKRASQGVRCIFHEAAIPSVPRSVEDPWGSHKANSEGTLTVLTAARDAGVKRVVFASSSSVYGDIGKEDEGKKPKSESLPTSPLSPYAATKITGEAYCKAFFHSYGLETVMLRYFNIFGPRQDPKSQYASVIPLFATAIRNGKSPIIFGDGLQTRDFTYVDNVVDANILAAEAEGAGGKAFNIACGGNISVLTLFHAIKEALGGDVEPRYEPPRLGDVKHSMADISLARETLSYEPKVDFEEGIRRTMKCY